jgi:hypothetical protein
VLSIVGSAAACGSTDKALGCGPAPLWFDRHGDVQAEDNDGSCARIERKRQDADPVCKACPYILNRVVAVRGDERFDVSAADRLEYQAGHHNWSDTARAELDDGRAIELTLRFLVQGDVNDPDGWTMDGRLVSGDGDVIDGPWSMRLLGGGPS